MIFRTKLHSLPQQASALPCRWVEPQENNILFTVHRITHGQNLNRCPALSMWAPGSAFSWFRTKKCAEWLLLSWHLWIHKQMFQMSLLCLQALLWSFGWIPWHRLFFLEKTAVKRRPGKASVSAWAWRSSHFNIAREGRKKSRIQWRTCMKELMSWEYFLYVL